MAQQGVIATNLPSFPWEIGDPLDAVPLNNIIFELKGQIANLQGQINALGTDNLAFAIAVNWGGGANVTTGPYTLIPIAAYDFILISADYTVGTSGGSFTFSLYNNGAAIEGLTGIVVNTFASQHSVATTLTQIKKGSTLTMIVDSVTGAPTNAWISLNGNTHQVPQVELGITTGTSAGLSNAVAFGTSAVGGEALASAFGQATTHFVAVGAAQGVGFTGGVATGDAHGVASLVGGRVATATGTSTAQATGTTVSGFPTLVLDDPVVGVLNQNPLG